MSPSFQRWKVPIAVLAVVLCCMAVLRASWNPLYTSFLIYRFKRAIAHRVTWGAGPPASPFHPDIMPVHREIHAFDNPDLVLDALWMISISSASTPEEAQTAGFALGCLSADDYPYFIKEGQTEETWRNAMRRFLDRWHDNPAPGNPAISTNFHKFEEEWRKKHP